MAYVNGRPVPWEDVKDSLIEAAGGQILVEWVLDRAIEKRMAERNIELPNEAVEVEKQLMLRTISDDPNQAARLLRELRNRRGLGKSRYEALLRRNASLRMLVQDEVTVPESAVRSTYDAKHGMRYEARLIVVNSLPVAGQVVQMARDGDDFSQLVRYHSVDPSKERGGVLEPISLNDATYPASIRKALRGMLPGQISDPIALQRGFAILKVDRLIEADGISFEQVQHRLREDVRREVERVLMARLARTMLEEADVVTLTPELDTGWKKAQQEINPQ